LQADLWTTAPKVNQLGRALWLTGADMLSAKSRSTTATDLSWNFAD